MPSGAKKRKAAKKKKEKETEINTNPSTTNLQGTVFHCTLLNFMHAKLTLFNFLFFGCSLVILGRWVSLICLLFVED